MGRAKSWEEKASCDCRKVGRLGCCNGGNRLSHPKVKVTTNYERSRTLPNVGHRKRSFIRAYREALSEAVAQGSLSRRAEEVALVLVKHSDACGKAVWPAHKRMGEKRKISTRSVGRQIRELKAKGWVAVKHRFRPTSDGIKGRSNVYLLMIPVETDSRDNRDSPVSESPGEVEHSSVAPNDDESTQPDPAIVELWKAALAAKDEGTVRRLAPQHLEFVPPAGIPLGVGTIWPLAVRLADRGPP